MYKIVGADGKEYGPVSLEQLQKWIGEGRVNVQTRVQLVGSPEWKTVPEVPEIYALIPGRPAPVPIPGSPAPVPRAVSGSQSQGLAIASLVLGILSFVACLSFLTGIPAIICGHIARNRARSSPEIFGGAGMALAGLILGYISLVLPVLLFPAMLLPALAKAKERAQSINCVNNMKQVGLAYRVWATDHGDQFPWGVSVAKGGTMELAIPGADTIDPNPIHFEVISNELNTPKILVCAGDTAKTAALQFHNLKSVNVTYQLHTGSNVCDAYPQQVLAICPIHGNVLLCDGSVQLKSKYRTRTR